MSLPFALEASSTGTTLLLRVEGTVGEDFSVPIVNLVPFKDIRIDCGKMISINSRGLKKFINWLHEVERANPQMRVHMADVQPTVNRQLLSMTTFLIRNLVIDSVYLPFYCDTCDLENQSTRAVASSLVGVTVKCPQCGKPMQFDGHERTYFALMRDRRRD